MGNGAGRETAEVVIIGGGVNGTSAAFHLASAGVRDVVLLERRYLSAGATGKSGALVRMHYTNPHESKLAFESLKIFTHWHEIVGGECGFTPTGFIQVVAPEHEEQLRANVAMQREIGIDTRVIPAAELKAMEPWVNVDDLSYVAYEPHTGYADPNATSFSFARRAAEMGARIRTHTEATRIRVEGGRVVGVDTTAGPIDAPVVLLAGGAWSNPLLAGLGLDYGLVPYRIQVVIFRRPAGFERRHMTYIDAIHDTWFRPEGDRSTLIGVELGVGGHDPEGYRESVDPEYIALAREKLVARFPFMSEAPMRGNWAGMIMMSPDGRPIIDQVPSVPGLFVMVGDSGTSFKTAPAIGKCLAEWITEGRPRTADLTPFRSTRFAEGQPWVDESAYGLERRTVSR